MQLCNFEFAARLLSSLHNSVMNNLYLSARKSKCFILDYINLYMYVSVFMELYIEINTDSILRLDNNIE